MWYKVLNVDKNASKEEVDKVYNSLINNPSIITDSNKKRKIDKAYIRALKHFRSQSRKFNKSIYIPIIICFLSIVIASIFLFEKPTSFSEKVTLNECLENNVVMPDKIDGNEMVDSLKTTGYTVNTINLVGNSQEIYADKDIGNYKINFVYYTSNNKGYCTLRITDVQEIIYKDVDANLRTQLITDGINFEKIIVTSRVGGNNMTFEPRDIVNQTLDQENFERTEIVIHQKDVEFESYLNYEYYIELYEVLLKEYYLIVE